MMRRIDARMVYKFEELVTDLDPSHHSNRWITHETARSLLNRVWLAERNIAPVPTLSRWEGAAAEYGRIYKAVAFYNAPENVIAIEAKVRCRTVVIHELTHAEGYMEHDRCFFRRYVDLLVRYAGCDPAHLTILQGFMGVRL